MKHVVILAAVTAAGALALSLVCTAYWLWTSRKVETPDYGLHVVTRGMR